MRLADVVGTSEIALDRACVYISGKIIFFASEYTLGDLKRLNPCCCLYTAVQLRKQAVPSPAELLLARRSNITHASAAGQYPSQEHFFPAARPRRRPGCRAARLRRLVAVTDGGVTRDAALAYGLWESTTVGGAQVLIRSQISATHQASSSSGVHPDGDRWSRRVDCRASQPYAFVAPK